MPKMEKRLLYSVGTKATYGAPPSVPIAGASLPHQRMVQLGYGMLKPEGVSPFLGVMRKALALRLSPPTVGWSPPRPPIAQAEYGTPRVERRSSSLKVVKVQCRLLH